MYIVTGLYHDDCPKAKRDANGVQMEFPEFVLVPDENCDEVEKFKCEKCGMIIGVAIIKEVK